MSDQITQADIDCIMQRIATTAPEDARKLQTVIRSLKLQRDIYKRTLVTKYNVDEATLNQITTLGAQL